MIRLFLVGSALALTACASTTETEPQVTEPVMLSDEDFQKVWDAAYDSEPESDSELAFAAMLEREDLTPSQRGMTYMGRGLIRGVFVRDWSTAFPQCALGDFMKAKEYPLPEARRAQLIESVQYQLSRQHYFTEAPETCLEYVAEAAAWRDSGTGQED